MLLYVASEQLKTVHTICSIVGNLGQINILSAYDLISDRITIKRNMRDLNHTIRSIVGDLGQVYTVGAYNFVCH